MYQLTYRSTEGKKSLDITDEEKALIDKAIFQLGDQFMTIQGVVMRKSQIVLIDKSESKIEPRGFAPMKIYSEGEMRKNWIRCIKAAIKVNPNLVQKMREGNMFAVNAKAMIKKHKIQPEEFGLDSKAYRV
jgi:uncharacterized protein YqeY